MDSPKPARRGGAPTATDRAEVGGAGPASDALSPASPELVADIVARVGAQPFARWFGRSMRGGVSLGSVAAQPDAGRPGATLVVAATTAFQLECVRERFHRELAAAAVQRLGDAAAVEYRVAPLLKLAGEPRSRAAAADASGTAHHPAVDRAAAPVGAPAPSDSTHVAAPPRRSAPRPARHAPAAGAGAGGLPVEAAIAPTMARDGANRPEERRANVTGGGSAGGAAEEGAGQAAGAGARSGPRLEDFVVGASNQLAFDAAVRMADPAPSEPAAACGARAPQSLFLHGECGVGKTHLLRGICRRRRELAPGQQVLYTTGEAFTNEFIAALRGHRLDEFRRWIRGLDLLAIDDVHFLADKQRTTSEFLHTIDAIGLDGNRVVLASDAPLDRIGAFSQALVSRLNAGMVVRIDLPDRTLRLALLRRLAARRGIVLEPSAEQELATRITGTAREIEGALHRLELLRDVHPGGPRPADVKPGVVRTPADRRSAGAVGDRDAEDVVGGAAMDAGAAPSGTDVADGSAGDDAAAAVAAAVDVVLHHHGDDRGERVRPTAIVSAVCSVLGLDRSELLGRSRHRTIVLGRMLVAWVCRDLTSMSFPEIARLLGRRNHSTVHCAYKRVAALMASRATIDGVVDRPNTGGAAPIDEVVELVARAARRSG